jgi:hypothetical protein
MSFRTFVAAFVEDFVEHAQSDKGADKGSDRRRLRRGSGSCGWGTPENWLTQGTGRVNGRML